MSIVFKRIWSIFSRPSRYVGRDLEGNKFFEYPSTSDDPRRTKRMIEYQPESRKWDYVSGRARLPVQWSMWLTHTRADPPSIEELRADIQRQQRVHASALELEKQYQAERAAQRLIPDSKPTPEMIEQPNQQVVSPISALEENVTKKERMKVPPSAPPPETQAWSPKTIRRGS
ncbi:hypothetical protein FRC14_003776 [Serendipita sp. 396]|nr:hypothetical protein FRC14_003776 [Serendipita sp. 396]KAG8782972.1 hypothetical protein FRC15_005980 [Serendipita sp. 397]KAG8821354.1 hypothetical protein FRC19_007914 [Serendipita sp. 401]KAG8828188.1 hypothetical protein FRC18_009789 [Serendipita sp. 400]KAG8867189.1 hypothetical protein FRC20_006508 [Serendipita sp. 405]